MDFRPFPAPPCNSSDACFEELYNGHFGRIGEKKFTATRQAALIIRAIAIKASYFANTQHAGLELSWPTQARIREINTPDPARIQNATF